MKLPIRNRLQRGQILVTTMVLSVVLGIVLAASLSLVSSNNSYTVRSQVWNNAFYTAEAGVEEAFAFINDVTVTNIAARNGFTWNSSSNAFYKLRTLDNTSYYEVCVKTNSTNGPIIFSIGYVQAPTTVDSGVSWLAAVSLPISGVQYLSRTVQVTTTMQPRLPSGLVIKDTLDCKGNNVLVDSYDSALGQYNTWIAAQNRYNTSDNGDVVLGNNTASVKNAEIKGHLSIGPQATVNVGPQGSVGSMAWVDGGSKGIQTGYVRQDSNFILPDVQPPWTGGALGPSSAAGVDYLLANGKYEVAGNLDLKSKQMNVNGNATLWVKGNVVMDNNSKVLMSTTGVVSRLTLYVSGSITFAGTWTKSIYPSDLVIYGLPSCTSVTVTTGTKLETAIYAPSAAVTLVGTADLRGGLAAQSARLNGNTSFHYDESLNRSGNLGGYLPTSWREL